MTLYEKAAASLNAHGLPITPQAVREVEHALKVERRAAAYDRDGVLIGRAG